MMYCFMMTRAKIRIDSYDDKIYTNKRLKTRFYTIKRMFIFMSAGEYIRTADLFSSPNNLLAL